MQRVKRNTFGALDTPTSFLYALHARALLCHKPGITLTAVSLSLKIEALRKSVRSKTIYVRELYIVVLNIFDGVSDWCV
jgi:hypothetical protein